MSSVLLGDAGALLVGVCQRVCQRYWSTISSCISLSSVRSHEAAQAACPSLSAPVYRQLPGGASILPVLTPE